MQKLGGSFDKSLEISPCIFDSLLHVPGDLKIGACARQTQHKVHFEHKAEHSNGTEKVVVPGLFDYNQNLSRRVKAQSYIWRVSIPL